MDSPSLTVHTLVSARYQSFSSATKKQKEKYLPVLATGEKLAAYALTEPGSGSDALGASTTAKLNEAGTHYVLNGEKQWITNSAFADVFVVYAKVDGDKFTAFIVEREFPGVSTGPEEKKMGIKSSSTRTLVLEDAEVPVENVLGEIRPWSTLSQFQL